MSYFLFIDESGHDRRSSPYEVLAGVAVEDVHVWPLVQALQAAEVRFFGRRYSGGASELKAKKLLNTKTFRKAALRPPYAAPERALLAHACLVDGAHASVDQIAALAQAKLEYSAAVFDVCSTYGCRVFASMVPQTAPRPTSHAHYLRKDYAYLFERYFNFLEERSALGCVVFDELEKTQSHLLVSQMDAYFKQSAKGRVRARRVIPEPFFVHSDLTTGIQLADLAAYVLAWAFRTGSINAPARAELMPYATKVANLRHLRIEVRSTNPAFHIWSVAHIADLRPRSERP